LSDDAEKQEKEEKKGFGRGALQSGRVFNGFSVVQVDGGIRRSGEKTIAGNKTESGRIGGELGVGELGEQFLGINGMIALSSVNN